MERIDVAIVGAGPYGISAAAHLTQIKGLEIKLFGEPMSFWESYMPKGMLLRSPWEGSHIADPGSHFSLNVYRSLNGDPHMAEPIPLKKFVQYGHWVYQQAGLWADPRRVMRIDKAQEGYRMTLQEGEPLLARRVVVAAGIQPFAYRPKLFDGFPSALVTHTSEHTDFEKFRGKTVLVIGGGQSAVESAALLNEAGARVAVLVRRRAIHWLGHHEWMNSQGFAWLFYGPGGIGPAGVSLIIERPNLYRRLPRWIQDWWGTRAIRPAVASWVKPRTQNVTVHTGLCIVQARCEGEQVAVRLSNGTEHSVDHVLLGTGYRINVARYPFFPPELLEKLVLKDGYPWLGSGFETSLPGLHILGAPAVWSFGPLLKFVAGTKFASRSLTQRVLQTKKLLVTAPGAAVFDSEPLGLEATSRKSH